MSYVGPERRSQVRTNRTPRAAAYVFLTAVLLVGLWRVETVANDAHDVAVHNRALIQRIDDAVEQIDRESRERRDQSCKVTEKAQRVKEQQLARTYQFLVAARANGETGSTIYKFIVASLPAQEAKARLDEAPLFCDEPGIGLPEPDPVVPPRPKGLFDG